MSVQQCNHVTISSLFMWTELSGGKVTLQIGYKLSSFPDGKNNYQSDNGIKFWRCASDGDRNAVIQWIAMIVTVHNGDWGFTRINCSVEMTRVKKSSECNHESQREYTEYNFHWNEI